MNAGDATRSSAAAVNIIVTCTNRKSRAAPRHLHLADLPAHHTATRYRDWITRLSQYDPASALMAQDLYAGEHWTIARKLPQLCGQQEPARLWACSAGYGLIPAEALIHPYAATFTTGHPDSVQGDPTRWWQHLSEWDGPAPGQPRTIRALSEQDPKAVLMLMLSPPYLRACRVDIAAAVSAADDPDRFMLISVGSRSPGHLAEIMVPADARLQSCMGGTRQSLNTRVGEYLLKAAIRSRTEASMYLSALLEAQPPVPRYDRKKLSDEQVTALIADGLARRPEASASRLLRELRDTGYACEQGRFGQLYQRHRKATS